MFGFNKTQDVLDLKRQELNEYVDMFNRSVKIVTDMVGTLDGMCCGIDSTIEEIEAYQADLEATKISLAETKAKNERVIKNFKALLGEDVTEEDTNE